MIVSIVVKRIELLSINQTMSLRYMLNVCQEYHQQRIRLAIYNKSVNVESLLAKITRKAREYTCWSK
jgi:hypothetical protein